MRQHLMLLRRSQVLIAKFTILFAVASSLSAAPPATAPPEGLRENTPDTFALTDARIVIAPGRVVDRGTVVVRSGVIVAVGADVRAPDDARVVNLADKTLYPGLFDAYSETAVDTKVVERGAPYWNPQVRPQLDVGAQYSSDKGLNEKLRGQGITMRLVAPAEGTIKGTSVLVTTGDDTGSRAILRDEVALHMRLTVSFGDNRDSYPNSPMGAVALARQAMYDADWYGRAWTAYNGNPALPRPERNDALEALRPYLTDGRLVVADTSNELFFLRADQFSREFGLHLVVRGSGDEYRRLDAIRDTGRVVLVPLNFPQPPNVATAEATLNVSLEQLMHWDLAPENPGRLERAGVRFALIGQGLKDPGEFLAAVRKAVERGLSQDAALRALTTTPAEVFGVANRLGTIEVGKAANLIVTDGDLFEKKTNLLETWVDGRRYELKPAPSIDVRGRWQITLTGDNQKRQTLTLRLSGETSKLSGTIQSGKGEPKVDDQIKLTQVALRDARLSATFTGEKLKREGTVRITAVVERAENDRLTALGHVIWPDGTRSQLVAERIGDNEEVADVKKDEPNKEGAEASSKATADKPPAKASFDVNYPLGEFGRSGLPDQPQHVLLRGATVWTSGPAGVLENASVLFGDGKIIAVGQDIQAPDGTLVIDARGKHVTPGIIDCHSHMATDGGINESGQAITAEVRIADFIDSNDINIYRQLAGGVTAANVLHGSANPIGGQNQVIKLRWSAPPEALKFAAAPPGIKFALGENVKQSNWGEKFTSRYPQTRMGVEQIMRDEFEAARRYQRDWQRWDQSHAGLPPRRDLELDAIVEVLAGQRWVHCHSYRQDEILALLRTSDDYGFRIGTLQHILEGYKVADEIARRGVMGSTFSDWWAYKFEVYDAIPYNGALMQQVGVVMSFNSDDQELARHLNHEAAKAVKYGGVDPVEALKFVTVNPAKQLRIEQWVGSLESGKDADVVVWSGSPLSTFTRCEQTWIDGRKYFDRHDDQQQRLVQRQMRATLIQKVLQSGEEMQEPDKAETDEADLWPREDEFCERHRDEK